MQILKSNKAQFEYEIHALVKAFYPAWDLKILTPESVVKDKKILETPPIMELEFRETEVIFVIHRSLHNSEKANDGFHHPNDINEVSDKDSVYTWQHPDRVSPADYKRVFGHFLYTSLREETGISLPWGNLTGIRPTKIAMTMLEQGKSEQDVALYLKEEHFVSDEKAALGIEIAKREREILKALHYEDGYSLYIGIPFCPTTCLYCSFTSYPISVWKNRVGDYLNALEKEIDAVAQMYRDKILDTVYIGGGTPTSLSAEELDRLLTKVKSTFDFTTVQEFTVEAGRADSITDEKLKVMRRHGVTRISVNPQTMNQETRSEEHTSELQSP